MAEFIPPPPDEPVPPPGPTDTGALALPVPLDDGIRYADPLSAGDVALPQPLAAATVPTGEQVIAYAETFKGIAKGRTRENVNVFTRWYYGNDTAAAFCLIGICYVFNHFGALGALLGGKIAYVPGLKQRVGSKWHTSKANIRKGDPVAFDFNGSGEPEHVGLFISWANSSRTKFKTFEFNTTGDGSTDWCGEKTRYWADVYGYVKPGLAPAAPAAYPGVVYRYAAGWPVQRGPHVTWIQKRLGVHRHKVAIDGEYSPATAAAVEAFQRGSGLTADGEVGPKTWTALAK